ncbi:MAG: Gfo/Idh/MocA family oxidoreductase [bacterium]|nr:Gfo/Idh/MocA family oxidoreductase [bacterium]
MTHRSAASDVRALGPSTPLRAGLTGTGLMGYWHAANIKAAGGRLVAVADPDTESARRLAGRYRNVAVFSDDQQMLVECDLDVLHVCTPLPSHREIAEHAIEAGVDLLIEKPLVPTAADTEQLLARAVKRNLLVCPVHQFAFQTGVRKAREQLARIGRIVQIRGVFHSAGGAGSPVERLDSIVADILPHPLSIMQIFVTGGVPCEEWVTARAAPGEFFAICETPGMTLSVLVSMSARPTECSFRIVGTEGTIHLDLFHGFSFVVPGAVSKGRKIVHPFDLAGRRLSAAALNLARRTLRRETAYPGLRELIGLFYDAVRSRSDAPVSHEDTLCVARARDQLIRCAGLRANQQEQLGS